MRRGSVSRPGLRLVLLCGGPFNWSSKQPREGVGGIFLSQTTETETEQYPQGYTAIKWKTLDSNPDRQSDSRQMLLPASKNLCYLLLKLANCNYLLFSFGGRGVYFIELSVIHGHL